MTSRPAAGFAEVMMMKFLSSLFGRFLRCPYCRQRGALLVYDPSRERRAWRCHRCRALRLWP
jgi:transposase-like protein